MDLQTLQSAFLRLNTNDFIKGAVTAVFAGVIFAVAGVVSANGFDVFTADWGAIGQLALNAAIAAFVGYLGKKFVTDDQGKVFGRI